MLYGAFGVVRLVRGVSVDVVCSFDPDKACVLISVVGTFSGYAPEDKGNARRGMAWRLRASNRGRARRKANIILQSMPLG